MEQFSKLLAARLARQQQTAEAHPDADALTAFAENRLKPNERKPMLDHLGICADCREVLSLLSPDGAPVQITTRLSYQWWNLRWVGALAAACLIAITVMHRPQPQPEPHIEVETKKPNANVTATMPPTAPPTSSIVVPKRKKFVPPLVVVEAKPAASAAQPVLLSPPATADLPLPSDRIQSGTLIVAAPPPPPVSQAFASQQPYALKMRAIAATPSFNGRDTRNLPFKRTPWKIGDTPGTLTSAEDGFSVKTARIDDHTNLYALSVSGLDIWAGGENGALFHSIDNGLHWNQVTVPFTDAITAIHINRSLIRLTTKSGEWLSSDGGHTWATK